MRIKNLSLILIFLSFLIKPVFANFDVNARTAIVQDYLSGKILYEKDADRQIFPASMTKIMTSIIAFDLLKSGELSLDDKFLVSENAWRLSQAGYSSMFIMVGDETDGTVIPQDLNLQWAVSKLKNDFIGKRAQSRKFLNSPDIRSAPIAGTKILSSCISEDLSTLTISWQANLYDTAGIIFLGLILK